MAPRLVVFTFADMAGHRPATLAAALDRAIAEWSTAGEEMAIVHHPLPRTYGAWTDAVAHLAADEADWCLLLDENPETDDYKIHVFAANLDDDPRPDANGDVRVDQLIDPEGAVAHRTRLPQDGIWDKFLVEGVPVRMAHIAGGHVFNHTLYRILQHVRTSRTTTRVGALETPPVGHAPSPSAAGRTPDQLEEELRMVFAVLEQLYASVPMSGGRPTEPSG